ncbi:MAG: hypothetical protein SV862_00170 [Pseudomonadota bacterium]|nr:hypothetical protein [Pseudomonadota bacterium]
MTITIAAFEGSETVSTTEHSLTTDTAGPDADTTPGIFQPFLDLNAMAAGDTFRFAIYETVASSGGTQRLLYRAEFTGAQVTPLWAGPSLLLGVGWDMTLLKIAGTDRAIVWRIAQVG